MWRRWEEKITISSWGEIVTKIFFSEYRYKKTIHPLRLRHERKGRGGKGKMGLEEIDLGPIFFGKKAARCIDEASLFRVEIIDGGKGNGSLFFDESL